MNTAIEIYNQIFSLCLPDFPPEQKQNENHKRRVVFTEKSQTQSDLTVFPLVCPLECVACSDRSASHCHHGGVGQNIICSEGCVRIQCEIIHEK